MGTLVLLNHCLRLEDNPLLTQAEGELCAVVTLSRQQFFGQQYGLNRANLSRLRSQIDTITALKQQLAQQQIGLVLCFGNSSQSLRQLAKQLKADRIVAAEPTAPEEYQLFSRLKQHMRVELSDVNSLLGASLRPDVQRMPDRFTTFRKALEPLLHVSASQPVFQRLSTQQWLSPRQADALSSRWQTLVALASRDEHALTAPTMPSFDEASVWQRINHYIWQQQHILHYKETRNGLSGADYASFFSAPLALGSLSVRALWQQIVAFEQQVRANDSTYWLKFELLWREFFRWQMRKYQSRWFSRNGIDGHPDFQPPLLTPKQQKLFSRWCQGETGVPFIDANMLLLNQSGLMSNRGRQNVASYLIHDLQLDWRIGAAYFEQRLLDYDPASNWGNWAYIAGYGNSEARPFNIIKQAIMYDPQAQFVKQMLPGLTAQGKQAHRPAAGTALPAHWRNWLAELD